MAGCTVAPLPFPTFPQSIFDIDRLGHLIRPAAAGSLLTTCSWESAESTYCACDGVLCGAKATVYDTQTEQEYCATHFREVRRG